MAKPKEWDDLDLYRVSARRRAIGAAVIMVIVIVLLPMMLNHSQSPKLKSDTNTTPQVSMAPAAPLSSANSALPPQLAPQDAKAVAKTQLAVNNQSASLPANNEAPKPIAILKNNELPVSPNKNTQPTVAKSGLINTTPPPTSQIQSSTHNEIPKKQSASQSGSNQTASSVEGSQSGTSQHNNEQKTEKNKSESHSPVTNNKNNSNKVLQLGLFTEESRAKTLVKEVKHHNLHAKIEKIKIKNVDRYRVYVGPFASSEKLHKTKKQLSDAGFASLVKDHH